VGSGSNLSFVIGAYAVMWVTVIGYALRLRAVNARARAALAHAQSVGGAQ
jgi:hypothetical protein